MRGQVDPEGGLFDTFNLEEMVPISRPLRTIDARADRVLAHTEVSGATAAIRLDCRGPWTLRRVERPAHLRYKPWPPRRLLRRENEAPNGSNARRGRDPVLANDACWRTLVNYVECDRLLHEEPGLNAARVVKESPIHLPRWPEAPVSQVSAWPEGF